MLSQNQSILQYNVKLRAAIQGYQVSDLHRMFGVAHLNIMLFGMPDAGKSAFLNSIQTALQNKYVELHNTMTHKNIVTRRLQKFRINQK